ncbi:hypothetical protein KYB31_06690 [Clostridium felsineum]|uniref:hypothetical protein n=1 Tax=Clostridium felsineum TaxID=36839 RepID=UPI00214DB7C3|nr:hypothetical protein [Clostridium felsineum]MCR3758682.1 hypothetical protein [Clostridium felsineum]
MDEKYIIYDNFIAEDGQTTFTVSKPYVSGAILVYLNGLLTTNGANGDYTSQDDTHIKFNYPLAKNDKIAIVSLIPLDGVPIKIISTKDMDPNSIYEKYGSIAKLQNNNEYTVSIKIKGKNYEWKFTSAYNPSYTTVKKIRMDTGDLLTNDDETINYLIYLNSKEIDMLYKVYSKNSQASNDIVTPSVIIQWKEAWVRYKTDLDLLNSTYISLNNITSGVTQKIGDIEISKKSESPLLTELQERFMLLFNRYDDFIKNVNSAVAKS